MCHEVVKPASGKMRRALNTSVKFQRIIVVVHLQSET